MTGEVTSHEELAHFESMYEMLKRSTPSAPDWFHTIDYCVGILMAYKLEDLKKELEA